MGRDRARLNRVGLAGQAREDSALRGCYIFHSFVILRRPSSRPQCGVDAGRGGHPCRAAAEARRATRSARSHQAGGGHRQRGGGLEAGCAAPQLGHALCPGRSPAVALSKRMASVSLARLRCSSRECRSRSLRVRCDSVPDGGEREVVGGERVSALALAHPEANPREVVEAVLSAALLQGRARCVETATALSLRRGEEAGRRGEPELAGSGGFYGWKARNSRLVAPWLSRESFHDSLATPPFSKLLEAEAVWVGERLPAYRRSPAGEESAELDVVSVGGDLQRTAWKFRLLRASRGERAGCWLIKHVEAGK